MGTGKNLIRQMSGNTQDNLIAGVKPPAYTTGVTLRAPGENAEAVIYPRGTVLAQSSTDGKLVILGSAAAGGETLTPAYILCDDTEVGAEDVPTAAYRSGCFNSKALTVAEGYELTVADMDNLRKYNIIIHLNMNETGKGE